MGGVEVEGGEDGEGFVYLKVQRMMRDKEQKDKQAATKRGACWRILFLLRRGGGGWERFVASRVARGGEKVEAEAEEVEVEVGMGMGMLLEDYV